MKYIDRQSPNFDPRDRAIELVILHYTGMKTGGEALARLRDPASKVSAHYLVEENGDIFRLVEESQRAWHAGVSSWKSEGEINARSIGVEIVNPGHEFGYREFPKEQIDAVVTLLKDIAARHAISRAGVLGHSDVAPRRKEDPGEKFPWARLADEGLTIGPYIERSRQGDGITYDEARAALPAIGYDAPAGDHAAALLAFQRRFCPASLGQGFDAVTRAALVAVRRAFE